MGLRQDLGRRGLESEGSTCQSSGFRGEGRLLKALRAQGLGFEV